MANKKGKPKNKAVEPHTQTASNKTLNTHDTSTSNQHAIVLIALRENPKTTIELRHDYGIMQPAPRIKELREQGHKIDTVRIDSYTPNGIKHHAVAKYVLHSSNDFNSEVLA